MHVTKRNVQNCTVDAAVRLQAILGRVDTVPAVSITESIREAVWRTTQGLSKYLEAHLMSEALRPLISLGCRPLSVLPRDSASIHVMSAA